MKVTVYHIYSEATDTYSGQPDQVRAQLNAAFLFLQKYKNDSLQKDLTKLSQQQSLMVNVED
jgi:hypothetical protein